MFQSDAGRAGEDSAVIQGADAEVHRLKQQYQQDSVEEVSGQAATSAQNADSNNANRFGISAEVVAVKKLVTFSFLQMLKHRL